MTESISFCILLLTYVYYKWHYVLNLGAYGESWGIWVIKSILGGVNENLRIACWKLLEHNIWSPNKRKVTSVKQASLFIPHCLHLFHIIYEHIYSILFRY